MIRVALVDDQAIVRAGLARILSPQDGFEVVAECADGRQAVDELPALAPEVVLMDIRMPVLDGIAATAAAARGADAIAVLVLTTFGEDEVLWGALEAGRRRVRLEGLLGRGADRRSARGGRRRGVVRSRGGAEDPGALPAARRSGRPPGRKAGAAL